MHSHRTSQLALPDSAECQQGPTTPTSTSTHIRLPPGTLNRVSVWSAGRSPMDPNLLERQLSSLLTVGRSTRDPEGFRNDEGFASFNPLVRQNATPWPR